MPLEQVRITLELEWEFVTATTLTDADGRYLICGLVRHFGRCIRLEGRVSVIRADVRVSGNTTLNIQMQH